MLQAITAEQARLIEARFVSESGEPLMTLMRRAGAAIAEQADELTDQGRIVVLAGPGNNGGDGWVAARLLWAAGRDVVVCSLKSPAELEGDAAVAAREASDAGVPWGVPSQTELADELADAELAVDALLGTGSRLLLSDELRAWCRTVLESGVPVLAVDVPTGVESDTGQTDPAALEAVATVTFLAIKRGLVLHPGAQRAGEIVVSELGVEHAAIDSPGALEVWELDDLAGLVPLPEPDAHKNSRGRVLIIAGSARFPGAAVLAARGAMRAGAGYVTVAVPQPIVGIIQSHLQAAPVVGLPAGEDGGFSVDALPEALELCGRADAVVLGPGLTVAEGAAAFARELYRTAEGPLLVDADGLNALVDHTEIIGARSAQTVLTPHPGELARLLGIGVGEVQCDRVSSSARLAGPNRVVVLKGAGTLVSDNARRVVVTSGTPALATAGTGDVLSGVIGALLAQGLDALDAAALGTHLHGLAGELAAADLTPVCVNAEDVPDYLPGAVASLLEW